MNDLPLATNGHFICNSQPPYPVDTVAELLCDAGFGTKLEVESRVTHALVWDPPSAECVPIQNDLPVGIHAAFSSQTHRPYVEGDTAQFTCKDGYVMPNKSSGGSSTLVLNNGLLEWNPPTDECVPFLNDLPVGIHATFSSRNSQPYVEGDTAHYRCDQGYATPDKVFLGTSTLRLNNGRAYWDPARIDCVPARNTLPNATHGDWESAALPPYLHGTTATLKCHDGHLSNVRESLLLDEGNGNVGWRPPSAECQPFLNDLPPATNGEFKSSKPHGPYVVGEVVLLHCDDGFGTRPGVIESRQVGGQWQPPSATCVPALRLLPNDPASGSFTSQASEPYLEGDVAELSCEAGYRASQHTRSTATLQADGTLQWSPPSIACIRVTCPQPPSVPHANPILPGQFDFTSEIEYRCEDGYAPNQPFGKHYCDVNGNWTPIIPGNMACEPVTCPELNDPMNGKVSVPNRAFGTVASYSCNPGYKPSGGHTRTCEGNGQWSGADVTCEPVSPCTKLPQMLRFRYRETHPYLSLDCGGGVSETLICLDNDKWSKQPPYCGQSLVAQPSAPAPQARPVAHPIPTVAPKVKQSFSYVWIFILLVVFGLLFSITYFLRKSIFTNNNMSF